MQLEGRVKKLEAKRGGLDFVVFVWIEDEAAAAIVDVANASYQTMLQSFFKLNIFFFKKVYKIFISIVCITQSKRTHCLNFKISLLEIGSCNFPFGIV